MEFTRDSQRDSQRDAQRERLLQHKSMDHFKYINGHSFNLFLFLVFFINDYSFHAVFDPIPNASNIRF